MKSLHREIVKFLAAAAVVAVVGGVAPAEAESGDDIIQEIVDRCRQQMGEYGAAMVKACADQDIAAVKAVNDYLPEHREIVQRCYGQMREYGWAMVKACADQDIAAEEALEGYGSGGQ